MFQLKDKKEIFGLSLGGGKGKTSNNAQGSRSGTKTTTGSQSSVGRKKGKNISAANKSQTSKGSTSKQGSTVGKVNARTVGKTSTTGKQNTSGSSTTNNRANVSGAGQSSLQQTLSSLDAGTQAQLDSILKAVGSPADASALQSTITDNALNANNVLNSKTGDIISAARRSGQKDINKTVTNLSKTAGSSQNSLVQQIGLEASVDLETELASLEASLFRENRNSSTNELNAASSGQIGNISSVANILKGANQTTQQSATNANNQSTTNVGNNTTQQNTANSSTQLVDTSTQTNSQQQTQELATTLQNLIANSTNVSISDIINTINQQSNNKSSVNENFNSSGSGKSSNIGFGASGGF